MFHTTYGRPLEAGATWSAEVVYLTYSLYRAHFKTRLSFESSSIVSAYILI